MIFQRNQVPKKLVLKINRPLILLKKRKIRHYLPTRSELFDFVDLFEDLDPLLRVDSLPKHSIKYEPFILSSCLVLNAEEGFRLALNLDELDSKNSFIFNKLKNFQTLQKLTN